jgi:hypothetical protein
MCKECTICRENKEHFWTCCACRNAHCLDCHEEIRQRRSRCPFCRSFFTLDNDCQDLLTYSFVLGNIHFIYRRTYDDMELVRLVLEMVNNDNDDDDEW